jgi:type VI secretion system protein ImpM
VKTLLFGKMPAHGDFVSRGFALERREALDLWLTSEIASAREALGSDFDDLYGRAPPWRFVVPDGSGWIGGALSPSVDGAGRKFPLLIARAAESPEAGMAAAAACEDALYDALEQGWTADQLQDWAPRLDGPTAAPCSPPLWWTEGNAEFSPRSLAGEQPPGLVAAMLDQEKVHS